MKNILILSVSLYLFGCASSEKYTTYSDTNGIARVSTSSAESPESIGLPEGAIRNEDGKLEFDNSRTSAHLEKLTAFSVHETTQGHKCDLNHLYLANRAQKNAVQAISSNRMEQAKEALTLSEYHCSEIGKISVHFYLQAIVAKELGEADKSKALAKQFLEYASSVEPRGFYSVDYEQTKYNTPKGLPFLDQELAFYRKQATSYLDGETSQLALTEQTTTNTIAKMYPNNPFRPGGAADAEYLYVLPIGGYSSIMGALLGVSVRKSWGKFSIIPNYLTTTRAGSYYGGAARYSVFETPNRDLDVDLMVVANNWKKLSYSQKALGGPAENVQVIDEGLNYGAGFGLTKRFLLPSIGLSAEGIGEKNTLLHEFKTYGTLYGFVDLTRGIDVFAGYLRNNPAAGLGILDLRIGYDFKDRSIFTYFNTVVF